MTRYPEFLYIFAIVGQTKFLGVSLVYLFILLGWEGSWAITDKKSESLKIMFMITDKKSLSRKKPNPPISIENTLLTKSAQKMV